MSGAGAYIALQPFCQAVVRTGIASLPATNGGIIISEPGEGALKFRAPDGTVAEIVGVGRYKKKKAEKAPA